MSGPIYTPRGRAREYSPKALNLYAGCDHGCAYCYNRGRFDCDHGAKPAKDIVPRLAAQLKREGPGDTQVGLSFVGDSYCNAEVEENLTRTALVALLCVRCGGQRNVPRGVAWSLVSLDNYTCAWCALRG